MGIIINYRIMVEGFNKIFYLKSKDEFDRIINRFPLCALANVSDNKEESDSFLSIVEDVINDFPAINILIINDESQNDVRSLSPSNFNVTLYFRSKPVTRVSNNLANVFTMFHDACNGIPLSGDDVDALDRKCYAVTCPNKVMLLMKGTKNDPLCGFSKKMVAILNQLNIDFEGFNILEDNPVRQRQKEIQQWNTYPQLYAYGTLIGGLDVIQDILNDGGFEYLQKEFNIAKE